MFHQVAPEHLVLALACILVIMYMSRYADIRAPFYAPSSGPHSPYQLLRVQPTQFSDGCLVDT